MAQQEQALWDCINLMLGKSGALKIPDAYGEISESVIENAIPINSLKGELVLKFKPGDIEDTVYFMIHRGYLAVHGVGVIEPELAYSLTEKALEVARAGKLPEEEEQAFKEALWNIKPNLWGMGPNMPEIVKRAKKIGKGVSPNPVDPS